MKKINFSSLPIAIITILSISLPACNSKVNDEEESKTKTQIDSAKPEVNESIPDSIIQFLITSSATDFNEHKPPTVIDVRNIKVGYISTDNEKMHLICGEYLSQEKNEWESFTTIKTSGYEQYIGTTTYCKDATFIKTDSEKLSEEIKNKLLEQKK